MKILAVATVLDSAERIDELVRAARVAAHIQAAAIELLITGGNFNDARTSCAGVDRIYRLDAAVAGADVLLDVLQRACELLKPAFVMLMANEIGMQAGPRLAVRANATYVSQCCGFESTPAGTLACVRPVYGGRALELLESHAALTVLTVKPKAFLTDDTSPAAGNAGVELLDIPVITASGAITRVSMDAAAEVQTGPVLDEARVIVAGGRGLGCADGFDLVAQLATRLGGAVGASRAAVDAGWIESKFQVGQTGTSVAPDLYIAVGISGAVQHLAGMSAARHVVAINTDEEAPIFGIADFGIVSDYRKIVPALLDALEKPVAQAEAE